MQDTACLGLVHGDDPEGCYGEGGGRGVQDAEHTYTHGRSMSMYGKTNTVLKKKKIKKKKNEHPYLLPDLGGNAFGFSH